MKKKDLNKQKDRKLYSLACIGRGCNYYGTVVCIIKEIKWILKKLWHFIRQWSNGPTYFSKYKKVSKAWCILCQDIKSNKTFLV